MDLLLGVVIGFMGGFIVTSFAAASVIKDVRREERAKLRKKRK